MVRKARELNVKILFVSNKGDSRWERLMAYLKRKGAHILCASSSKESYDMLRNNPVNIMIADYDHSDIKGLAFLKKTKKLRPHIELIFLSEKATMSTAIEAMKEGAYDFYEFPVNTKLILAVIKKAIEKETLSVEKTELEQKVKEKFDPGKIIGRSKAMQHVLNIVGSISPKNVTILLTGETGSGKEMIASAIHYNSPRASKPFIGVNCAALSEGVLESELFGHEKGSFTGAVTKRIGRFELAESGTMFLDEIGDMPPGTQVKLLRVLQEKSFERVGGNDQIKVDVRVIAATHQDLRLLIHEGRFREDLFYRLNVVHIELPPLRKRKDDIPLLVSSFIQKFNDEKDYGIKGITKEAMQILLNYKWPGNIRELENAIESAMALSTTDIIDAKYLPSFLLMTKPQDVDFYQIPQNLTLQEMEQEIISQTLAKTNGNQTKAARLLGIGLRTIQRKVKGI
jgi:DNA-binding NtrC family response regulator